MALRFIELDTRTTHYDSVAGVCYVPAAEDIIKMNGLKLTVIGYLVDDEPEFQHESPTWADRDRAREAELVSRTRIKTDYDLRELGAIRRRLGREVV